METLVVAPAVVQQILRIIRHRTIRWCTASPSSQTEQRKIEQYVMSFPVHGSSFKP